MNDTVLHDNVVDDVSNAGDNVGSGPDQLFIYFKAVNVFVTHVIKLYFVQVGSENLTQI